jgi:hypothetical protein
MKHLTCIVLSAFVLSLAGCGKWFKAKSPISGQEATDGQLARELAAVEGATRAETGKLADDLAEAELKREQSKARAKQAFETAVRNVQTIAEQEVQKLGEEFAQAEADANGAFALVNTKIAARVRQLSEELETTRTSVASAREEIARKRESMGSLLAVGETVTSAFGSTGGILGAGIGLLGTVLGLKGRRDANATREAATRIIDAIDIAKEKDPIFAAKFKEHGTLLASWMGAQGVQLVQKAQEAGATDGSKPNSNAE